MLKTAEAASTALSVTYLSQFGCLLKQLVTFEFAMPGAWILGNGSRVDWDRVGLSVIIKEKVN